MHFRAGIGRPLLWRAVTGHAIARQQPVEQVGDLLVIQCGLRNARHPYQELTATWHPQEITDKTLHARCVVGRRAFTMVTVAAGTLQLVVHRYRVARLGNRHRRYFVAGGGPLVGVGQGSGLGHGGQQAQKQQ
ncbi:hypothetical protein D3C80_1830620 [compost metagenome]